MKNSKRMSGERGAAIILSSLVVIAVLTVGILWFADDGHGPASVLDGEGAGDSSSNSSSPPSDMNSGKQSSSSSSSSSSSPSAKFKPGDNPHSAGEVCGKGFKEVDKVTVTSGQTTVGAVKLLYNASNGKNCVVTMKTVDIKKKTPVSVWLKVKGGKKTDDSGKFDYYAGPVTLKAKSTCVKFGGGVSDGKGNSGGWSHCG